MVGLDRRELWITTFVASFLALSATATRASQITQSQAPLAPEVIAATRFALSPPRQQPSDTIGLSSQQQKTVWNDLSAKPMSPAPSTFNASTTSALPSTVRVQQIPAQIAQDIPALRPYDYAKTQGKLLIVNPKDMMIAEVITD